MAFTTIVQYVIHNCLSLATNKQDTELLTAWSCYRLPHKSWFSSISFSSTVCVEHMNHPKLQRLQISACWWLVSSWCSDCSDVGLQFFYNRKKSNQREHMKVFSITKGGNIFRIRSDSLFWLKYFANTKLKIFLEDNV